MKRIGVLIAASTIAPAPGSSDAQEAYPSKPIRLIVPAAAGGSADIAGRLIAGELTKQMGQQIVVDNRGGILGYEAIARAAADGYTVGLANFPFITNPLVFSRLSYDTAKDFQPVIHTGYGTHVLTVTPTLQVYSVRELIDYARAQPGKLSYAGGTPGGNPTLALELFKSMSATQVVQVPYKSFQQATTDTIAGQVHILCENSLSILPYVRAGRLRAVGVTTLKRLPVMPDLPTIAESGLPGFEAAVSSGYIVPARTPRDIVLRLNTELNKALKSTPVTARAAADGYVIAGGTPEQFTEHVRRETVKWAAVIKAAGIKSQ
jgi:tripartite-type tricarboxylate transporter receptor subunit TctC